MDPVRDWSNPDSNPEKKNLSGFDLIKLRALIRKILKESSDGYKQGFWIQVFRDKNADPTKISGSEN